MRDSTALPLEFRPASGLLWISVLVGILCGVGAARALLAPDHGAIRVATAALLLAPTLLAMALLRRRIRVDHDGLTVTGLTRSHRAAWPEVLAVEQTRQSFVIITERGDISAGWIDAKRRDLLFRKVLELAQLVLDPKEPRWGIRARFVRAAPFVVPREALRRQPRSEEQE